MTMQKVKHGIALWGPPILWMAAIFVVSGTPGRELPSFGTLDYFVKKAGHTVAYGLLAVLFRRALGWQKREFAGAWLLAVLYALSDEFHQSFIPGRHPSLVDALGFDGVGAAAGLLASWLYRRRQPRASMAEVPKD